MKKITLLTLSAILLLAGCQPAEKENKVSPVVTPPAKAPDVTTPVVTPPTTTPSPVTPSPTPTTPAPTPTTTTTTTTSSTPVKSEPKKPFSAPLPSENTTLPSNIYPGRAAKSPAKFGQMSFEGLSKGKHYAIFNGKVELSGRYQFFPKGTISSAADKLCFTIDNFTEFQKLPQSKDFYDQRNPKKFFCFSNIKTATKLLGKDKGTATITINSLFDLITPEGETYSTAVLEKVASKKSD